MSSTYSTNLAIELIGTGDQAGTWGTTTNTNLGTLIEQAISGYTTQAITDGADTVLVMTSGASATARNMTIECTGALTATRNLIVPANKKLYFIYNNTTGGYAVTVKVSAGTGVSVPNGAKMVLVCNATDVYQAVNYMSSPTFASPTLTSPILGTPASGTLTNCTSLPIATGVSGLGTSVATALAVNVGSAGAFVTNGGALGTPSSGTLTNCSGLSLTAGVTGTLPIANGGTGLTSTPANGALDIGNGTGFTRTTLTAGANVTITNAAGSITIASSNPGGTVTSVGGTGSVNGITLSGTVTSSGNLTLGGTLSGVSLTSQVTGTLPVANGGTGQTSYTDGQLLIGNSSGNTLSKATLTAGSNITITNGNGSITIASSNPGGTVTSVGGTGSVNGITLSGTVTSSGNLTLGGTLSNVSLSTQVTGTLPVGNGGSGATTLSGVLYGNGTSAFTAASAAQIVSAIGSTAVTNATNATYATTAGNGGVTSVNGSTGAVTVGSLGVSQTYTVYSVGSTRQNGVTYTNSTSLPILVFVCGQNIYSDIYVSGTRIGGTSNPPDYFPYSITFVVPAGATYQVNVTYLSSWSELR